MFENNRITSLLGITYPIIQGGMVWVSGWRLASAVSNAGGLGIIGAGSMDPALLLEHINKCKKATDKPFGVNIPLLFKYSEDFVQICVQQKVPIVITSAGNPKAYTQKLKDNGIKVIHVVSSTIFAQKAESAGVDAIVAEGFEAGGHNGREETTTMVLIPSVVNAVKIPVIAAGGIATGSQMFATFALGAEGVQIGTRFIATHEASAHENFKKTIIRGKEGDTMLILKSIVPTRLYKNQLYQEIEQAEIKGLQPEQIKQIIGENKAKLGMFEGNIEQGLLEVGQNISLINEIKNAHTVIQEIIEEFYKTKQRLNIILR